MSNKRKAIGRRPYTLNQKTQVFADSRLKRDAGGDSAAIEEQTRDLGEVSTCVYCGRDTRSPRYEPGPWVAPMVYPHSVVRWPDEYLQTHPYLLPHCVHSALAQMRGWGYKGGEQ